MKKILAVASILVFLTSLAFFIYTNNVKSNSLTNWSNNLNADGTWLGKENTYVSRSASIRRVNGYIIDFMQKEDDPTYFLTLKIEDDVNKEVVEVQIPKRMNTDIIKLTEDDIVAGIRNGDPVVVSIATDLKSNTQYLDFISIIETTQ